MLQRLFQSVKCLKIIVRKSSLTQEDRKVNWKNSILVNLLFKMGGNKYCLDNISLGINIEEISLQWDRVFINILVLR